MSLFEQAVERDAQRRQAMISADQNALNDLLADDLTWTHSSGATESKAEFIAAIVERRVVYEQLDVSEDQLRGDGEVVLHNGRLRGRASRDGQAKALHAKFLAVWRVSDGQLRLAAWQSTNCNE